LNSKIIVFIERDIRGISLAFQAIDREKERQSREKEGERLNNWAFFLRS